MFTKFRDSQANIADMFGVERKKFFTSITGHTHDVGKKLMKAEKKEWETHDLDQKKQKMMEQETKPEKQETKAMTRNHRKKTLKTRAQVTAMTCQC